MNNGDGMQKKELETVNFNNKSKKTQPATASVERNRLYRLFNPSQYVFTGPRSFSDWFPDESVLFSDGSTGMSWMRIGNTSEGEVFELTCRVLKLQDDRSKKVVMSKLKAVAANETDSHATITALTVNNVEVDLTKPAAVHRALDVLSDIVRPVYYARTYERASGKLLSPVVFDEDKLKRDLYRPDTKKHPSNNLK